MDEKPCPPNPLPNTTDYVLWLDLYEASVGGMNRPLKVEIEFGSERRVSDWTYKKDDKYMFKCESLQHENLGTVDDPVDSQPGKCQFRTFETRLPFMNVERATEFRKAQLPDIIINVYAKGRFSGKHSRGYRVGFIRHRASDVWKGDYTEDGEEWHPMQGLEDEKGQSKTIGYLLYKLVFAPKLELKGKTRQPMTDAVETKTYTIRAHVYQARNLRSNTSTGLSNPIVKCRLGKNEMKFKSVNPIADQIADDAPKREGVQKHPMDSTKAIAQTLSPVWWETLEATGVELSEHLSQAEDFELSVYNAQTTFWSDEYTHGGDDSMDFMGRVRYPPRLCVMPGADPETDPGTWNKKVAKAERFSPMWFPLRRSNEHLMMVNAHLAGGDEQGAKKSPYSRDVQEDGSILVMFEVVEEGDDDDDDEFPLPHPWPQLKECTFQMVLLGCRNLFNTELFAVKRCCVEVRVPTLFDRAEEYEAWKREVGDSEEEESSEGAGASASESESGSDGDYDENKGNDSDEGSDSDESEKYNKNVQALPNEQCYRYTTEPNTLKGHSPYCFKEVNFKISMPTEFIYAPCMSIIVRDGDKDGGIIGYVEVPLRDHSLDIYKSVADAIEDGELEEKIEIKYKPTTRYIFGEDHKDDKHVEMELKGDDEEEAKGPKGMLSPDTDVTFELNKGKPIDVDALNNEFEDMYDGFDEEHKIDFQSDSSSAMGDPDNTFWPGDIDEEVHVGRKTEEDQLENNDKYAPVFEVWKLENGPDLSVSAATWADRGRGTVKGFVRVVDRWNDGEQLSETEKVSQYESQWVEHYGKLAKGAKFDPKAKSKSKPQHVKVRVYCIEASNLQPLNKASFWDNGKSVANPFLSLRMVPDEGAEDASEWRSSRGVRSHNEENTPFRDTINPKFASWYDMDAIIPGMSTLEIKVMHKKLISSGEIGSTRIDLEDRWFSPGWQALMVDQRAPKEFRSLFNPSARLPRGKLEMWAEVHTEAGYGDAQVASIMPDKVTTWEVRVVVWETNKIPKKAGRRTADLYVVGELVYFTEDGKKAPIVTHETDYHEGVRDGNATLHERMKFPVQVSWRNNEMQSIVVVLLFVPRRGRNVRIFHECGTRCGACSPSIVAAQERMFGSTIRGNPTSVAPV